MRYQTIEKFPLLRMFSTFWVKGERDYLDSQKKYEILRTVLYFAISFSLFLAGYIHTGTHRNLLTVVAMLGCLPAAKSAVSMIMFLRYRSCTGEIAELVGDHSEELGFLYDCVFTSYSKNYIVNHLVVRGNTLCGFSEKSDFPAPEFYHHITDILKKDRHKDVNVKIYTDLDKYVIRLDQINELPENLEKTAAVLITLKNAML